MSQPKKSSDNEIIKKYHLTQDEWQRFCDIEDKQRSFHQWLVTKNLASTETKALSCKTVEDSAKYWTETGAQAQYIFDSKHQKGWRLWARKYQSFSQAALSFMNDFKPIIDVAKSMGGPYSGLAVGTVTILLTFAGRKNDIEDQIAGAIEGIKDRFPGLKMYQAIYTSSNELEVDLRKKILFAYLAFMDLSMEIIKYYLKSGLRRWNIALFNSSKFKDMVDDVYSLLSNIRLRCEELLSFQVNTLVQDMNKLKEFNKELLSKVDDLQRAKDFKYLQDIHGFLGLPSWTPDGYNQGLSDYKDRLDLEHSGPIFRLCEQMTMTKIESLRQASSFVEWNTSSHSSLLILRGINNEYIRGETRYNWVSPFVLDLVARFRDNTPPTLHAVYVFDPSPAADPESQSLFTAIPTLLLQLLYLQQVKLGDTTDPHHETRTAVLDRYSKIPQSESESDEKAEVLGSLAEQVISLFETGKIIYIVLDRVELCSNHYGLMRILVNSMMNKASCVVKILLVAADSMDWPRPTYFRFDQPTDIREVPLVQKLVNQDMEY